MKIDDAAAAKDNSGVVRRSEVDGVHVVKRVYATDTHLVKHEG
jgi:hypothetical protein